MRRIILTFLTILIAVTIVHAEDWKPVGETKPYWNYSLYGLCKEQNQCLVKNSFNESYDNQPERYWSQNSNSEKPKCITTGQYIEDNYCEQGKWTSRTKLTATQLLAIAKEKSPNNFAIYCDTYDKVLNRYSYSTEYGLVTNFLTQYCKRGRKIINCTNNICVLKTPLGIAFGMAINTDIDGQESPLHALNLSRTQCNSAKNNDGDYDTCGNNVWYNHNTESIIYIRGLTTMPQHNINEYLITPYNEIKEYAKQYSYSIFEKTPMFNQLYIAKNNETFEYAIQQQHYTLNSTTFIGYKTENITVTTNLCDTLKRIDNKAKCEKQTGNSFNLVTRKTAFDSNDLSYWNDLTGKIRLIQ